MISRLFILLFFGIISECYGNAPKLPKAKKLNLKVHINATSDTLVMKFLRPNNNIKLEGFILGYGSNFFSNQYIQWPENGKSYVTEVDAEPRYLIALKPNENSKKSCKEKTSTQKPLQVVIGTLTPTSVFLSWGILINPQFDWSTLNKCPNDRFYTVRYREKNKDWLFQLCPTTETVIDNLKPNTAYEFCVKDNTDDGIWSKPHNHKTTSKGKENGQSQNTYKVSKDHIQVAPEDAKAMIPILVIKQGIQNLTNLYQPKSTSLPSSTEQSPVHKEEAKKPIKTTIPKAPTPKPKSVSKVTELPPVSKTSEESETEDIKPAVTSDPVVESFTPDSSTGTLEWVRATMDSVESHFVYSVSKSNTNQHQLQNKPVTHPYIAVPNVSPESDIDEQSQRTPLVFVRETNGMPAKPTEKPLETFSTLEYPRETIAATFASVLLTRTPPIDQPKTVLATERLTAKTTEKTTAGMLPVSADVPQMITNTPHGQQGSTLGMHPISTDEPDISTNTYHGQQRTTQGMQPVPTDEHDRSNYSHHVQRIPFGSSLPKDVTTKMTTVPVKQSSPTQAANEEQPEYVPTKVRSLETQTHHGSSLPKVVTTKMTTVPVKHTRPTQGMHQVSTDEGEVSSYTSRVQQSTTPVARVKQPRYEPTSKPSLETYQPQHGMHTVAMDESDVITYTSLVQQRTSFGSSPPKIATRRASVPEEQTSSTQDIVMAPSARLHPVPTDVPDVSTYKTHLQQKTKLAADERQPMRVPATKYSSETQQLHHGLPTPSFAPDITSKTTFVPVEQTSLIQAGMQPVSTDEPDESSYTHHVLQRTTLGLSVTPSISVSVPDVTAKIPPAPTDPISFLDAAREKEIYSKDLVDITEIPETSTATTIHAVLEKHTTLPSQIIKYTTTAFIGSQHIATAPQDIAMTEVPLSIPVPKQTSTLPSKPIPSTEALHSEVDTRQYITEIITTEAPHTYEQEKITIASSDTQKTTKTSRPETKTKPGHRKTPQSFTSKTPITSKSKTSTLASKDTRPLPTQIKPSPTPEAAQSTPPVFKETQTMYLIEETTAASVPNETQKVPPSAPKATLPAEIPSPTLGSTEKDISPKETTESPSTEAPKISKLMPINLIRVHFFDDPKSTSVQHSTEKDITPKASKTRESPSSNAAPNRMPINVIRLHIFDDPKVTSVPGSTEKDISPAPKKTTDSPSSTKVPMIPYRMPINVIRLHIFDDPKVTSAPSETHITSPPTPKTTQSNKLSRSKPAPKTTQRTPINILWFEIFGEPEGPLAPNTTQAPPQPQTTQRTEHLQTKLVPNETQKVSTHKTKKPKPTSRPRAKPVSTGAPKESSKPKIPPQSLEATFAPYKLQLSSSRPKTSVRPRTRPAQNGTTQGSVRARPTGDVNWMTGTIPGGRSYDNSKLLGVSRNISMEPNSTRKKMFSVSSPPQLPIRPTAMRRRIVPNNVTGRPGSTGSVLVPRAPSTARPNRTPVGEMTQKKQPTLPPEDNTYEDIVFSPGPKVDLDALGKPRYTAPHVKYIPKKDLVPCSITDSLKHFSTEEAVIQEATKAPENPPSNLTVVTVEGCPSFVILDWEQPDNDTVTEYEIISHENGAPPGKEKSIITTNQTFSTVENLQPDKSYEFKIKAKNEHGEGPFSETVEFNTESADPRVSEPVTGGKDAIWTEIKFKSDSYSECKGKQYVKRTWYKKFVGIQLCNSLRYKIYLSDTLSGTFYNIGDQSGYGEDHCQFVDSFLDGRTGQQLSSEQLTTRKGFYRSVRQQPVEFGEIGRQTHSSYVHWYECGIAIPGKW